MTEINTAGSLPARRAISICLVAGEHSGDALGAALMAALRRSKDVDWTFAGIGGPRMEEQGLRSAFPLSDVAIMGPLAIAARLPTLIRRVYQAVAAVIAAKPAALVIIDSPEFTHAVARRVRRHLPALPIIDYVSPSVWAWRQGRAKRMRAYVDHVLAILPFEPDAHRKLSGPACTYVGHPLAERLSEFEPDAAARRDQPYNLLVLPGSRVTEVRRLMQPFGDAVALLARQSGPFNVVIPVPDHVRPMVEALSRDWTVKPRFVSGEAEKLKSFRQARAALAASGTVTLELALAQVPMAVGYRIDPVAAALRFLLKVHSVVLPNLIIGRNAVPEFIQERCTPELLAQALAPLLVDSDERTAQMKAFNEVRAHMLADGINPSERAAGIVRQLAGV